MSQRIHSIDAVRAMALLGILLVHAHDGFNAYATPAPVDALDTILDWVYRNLMVRKAFMVFSFLFGLSFFLQMDHAMAKGIDFRGRFCWRLILLLGFGLLHSFFYYGDILVTFSLVGFIPVLLWKVRSKTLAILAVICLLFPVDLLVSLSGHVKEWWHLYDSLGESLHLAPMPDPSSASFWQMDSWNLSNGLPSCLLGVVFSHRIWGVLGMFLLGMLAGRSRLFEGGSRRLLKVSLWGLAGYALALLLYLVPGLGDYASLDWWGNTCYVIFFVPLLAWLFSRPWMGRLIVPLTAIGRCTLTCYMTQSIIMLWIFCGYGLGWGGHLTVAQIMGVAACLFLVQLVACNLWLRFFRYGPLEGIWRRLTRIGMAPNPPARS